jgi:hypothetical protein
MKVRKRTRIQARRRWCAWQRQIQLEVDSYVPDRRWPPALPPERDPVLAIIGAFNFLRDE